MSDIIDCFNNYSIKYRKKPFEFVIITINGKKYKVDKANLILFSRYFESYFSGNYQQDDIEIPILSNRSQFDRIIQKILSGISSYEKETIVFDHAGDNEGRFEYPSSEIIDKYYLADFLCIDTLSRYYKKCIEGFTETLHFTLLSQISYDTLSENQLDFLKRKFPIKIMYRLFMCADGYVPLSAYPDDLKCMWYKKQTKHLWPSDSRIKLMHQNNEFYE